MTEQLEEKCPECDGEKWVWVNHGSEGYQQDDCPTCHGTGMYSESGRGSDGFEKCPICGGEGKLLQYDEGRREEIGCDYCQCTGKAPKADPK